MSQTRFEPFFQLHNSYSIELDAEEIDRKDWGASSFFDSTENVLYIPLRLYVEKNEILILAVNVANGKEQHLYFKIPKKQKFDFRCGISSIRKWKGEFYIKVCEEILHYSSKREYIDQFHHENKWKYFNIFTDGHFVLGFYYDHHPLTSRKKFGLLIDEHNGTKPIEIYPPSGLHALTNFSPNELISNNAHYVFSCNVSSPRIYSYGKDLQIRDSIIVPIECWVDPESLLQDSHYRELLNKGAFEFGSVALLDTCSKSLGIQTINDSTLIYISCNTLPIATETILHVNKDGKFTLGASREIDANCIRLKKKDAGEEKLKNEDIEFMNQTAKGLCSQNHLFYIALGPEKTMQNCSFTEYTKLSEKTPPRGKTYLQIYDFTFNE